VTIGSRGGSATTSFPLPALTTSQNGKEPCDRFRVVFPLARPVSAGLWEKIKFNIETTFAPGVDLACEKISQPYTLPCARPGHPRTAFRNAGKLLDISDWKQHTREERKLLSDSAGRSVDNAVHKLLPDSLLSSKEGTFTPDSLAVGAGSDVKCEFDDRIPAVLRPA
jgi:hypothetical protein